MALFPGQTLGNRADVIAPGGQVGLLNLKGKQGESGLYVLTLTPSVVAVGTNTTVAVPLLGLFARIQFGEGQVAPYSVDVDIGRGISFAMRGAYLNVTIFNQSASPALGVSAFVSEGDYTNGVPQRTVQGTQGGGVPITFALPLAPAGITDEQQIPNMAKSVSIGNIGVAGATYNITFIDQALLAIVGYSLSNNDVVSIEVPADAAFIVLQNTSAAPIEAIRYVYDLDL